MTKQQSDVIAAAKHYAEGWNSGARDMSARRTALFAALDAVPDEPSYGCLFC